MSTITNPDDLAKTISVGGRNVEVDGETLTLEPLATRYDTRQLLGKGGMGIVELQFDRRIGREVARKQLLAAPTENAARRFVREARIQGQLEHPSVVPVYDLAVSEGTTFFTMKRVRGSTLEEIIERLRDGDTHAKEKFTRRRLLTAFVSVCLGVDFAHSRGVLHRDLKPANVMLGDFGEVYVLDWGIAKVVHAPKDDAAPTIESQPGETQQGSTMGTLGYMSPEQLEGKLDTLDSRTDVYSLGAMLFELITLMPLHPRGTMQQLITDTLRGAEARPSVRTTATASELDPICAKAAAPSKDNRYASARALAEAVELFLDGEGDRERRRTMAVTHTTAALALLNQAKLPTVDAQEGLSLRRRALADLGKAIAFDASAPGALETLGTLLHDAPRVLPAEVNAELEADADMSRRTTAQTAGRGFAFGAAVVTIIGLWRVRNFAMVAALDGTLIAAALTALYNEKRKSSSRIEWRQLVPATVAVMCISILFGPLFVQPGFAAVLVAAWSVAASDNRKEHLLILAFGVAALLIPTAIELLGVFEPTYTFTEQTITIRPPAFWPHPVWTIVMVIVLNLIVVIITWSLVGRTKARSLQETRQSRWVSWQLRQLISQASDTKR